MFIEKAYHAHEIRGQAERLSKDLRVLLEAYARWAENAKAPPPPVVRPLKDLNTAFLALRQAATARGLAYADDVLKALLLSLKTKPFCILAGPTGTGKSALGRLLSDLGADVRVVPVEPSWTDGSSIIGYRDLDGNFRPGVLAEHAHRALECPDRVHVLVLDELNLARVEHYLAQWLSVVESRRLVGERVVGDFLVEDGDDRISLPANFCIVGTVNMDESTLSFSQRVLDRANVLFLPSPEGLLAELGEHPTGSPPTPTALSPDVFRPAAVNWSDLSRIAGEREREAILIVLNLLQATQEILDTHRARARISFRLRDEIAVYLLHGLQAGVDLSTESLLDQQLRQRLLPKLCDGSVLLDAKLVEALVETWKDLSSSRHSAVSYLRAVESLQKQVDMPVPLWSALS